MNRPASKVRLPELLYVIGCEGENQERLYFERIKLLLNSIPKRKKNINFLFAEPYGGNPKCVVQRTIEKSIGKENKLSVFDYDGKTRTYEEAIDLGIEKGITLGHTNYCFDLWLILHKEEYYEIVSSQNDYAIEVKKVFNLPIDANIKKENRVKCINEQIEIDDVLNAIKRAKAIESSKSSEESMLTPNGNAYYSNPDTQMHKLMMKIFKEVGILNF